MCVCRHFRLSNFLSKAERLCTLFFLSQTPLPATQHGHDAVGAAAVLLYAVQRRYTANFKSAADRKVSFESSFPNRPPASPAQVSVSSPPTGGVGGGKTQPGKHAGGNGEWVAKAQPEK